MGEYTVVGKLNKSFGNEGGIRFSLYSDFETAFQERAYLFLLLDGLYVPFFKDRSRINSSDLLFLTDINTLDEINELSGNYIYLPNEDLPELPNEDDELEYSGLKGYSAYELNGKLIGEIDQIRQYPMQEMAIIEGSETILIPLNDELIHEIDAKSSKIVFDLPEGLLP